MDSRYDIFLKEISSFISQDRIYTDELHRISWGTDAGCYRLNPKIVVRSENEEDISKLLSLVTRYKLPVTFRAAGTSLSGQSVSDSILIVAGKNWEHYEIGADALSVKLQPGIVGAKVNDILRPYGRCFGPDPASINSCMVGGIVMNNASGMSCGTHSNSDKELLSARLVFADGTVLDTADENSRREFAQTHGEVIDAIIRLRDEINADAELRERIKYKYSIKNVTGLNINPFVTQYDPFDIIAHLMVGSEGTLAFLSEVTMKTQPVAKFKASAMIYFDSIRTAAEAVVAMRNEHVSAAELLDRRSLLSVNDNTGDTAVLTETQADTEEQLDLQIAGIKQSLSSFKTVTPIHFTADPREYARYWAIRSGIFPSVGGMREIGTTCIIEDVAFHIQDLPDATEDLSNLLERHGYTDSCIYGHALEGNFHFIINQAFDTDEKLKAYEDMINDVTQMVVGKYDGSLKAEHGTGRNMAPFVEYEWGKKAFDIMRRVKDIFDPDKILNPGVIFNDDSRCHLKNFKALPVIYPGKDCDAETVAAYNKINKCIECGFCEVNCVSCGFTMSPRTRIVINREIERRRKAHLDYAGLEKAYRYPGEETCAGDGLCSMSCPMGINVGDLTHELRRQRLSSPAKKFWQVAASHFPATKEAIRGALALAQIGQNVLGDTVMSGMCSALHHAAHIPLWTPSMPHKYKYKGQTQVGNGEFTMVYLPSCLNQMMGVPKDYPSRRPLVEETLSLLAKAGCRVIIPENREELCCGTIWESKGLPDIAEKKIRETEEALLHASNNGAYPVLCDQSPCLHRMRKYIRGIKLYEPAEFIWTFLRDRLEWHQYDIPVAIHTTCSTRLMKLEKVLFEVASLCSTHVLLPEGVGCCAYAGDKGMTHPELNKWATRKLRKQIEDAHIPVGYSNSRTCEIGLQHNSGIPYMSIVYLVNQCTQPLN